MFTIVPRSWSHLNCHCFYKHQGALGALYLTPHRDIAVSNSIHFNIAPDVVLGQNRPKGERYTHFLSQVLPWYYTYDVIQIQLKSSWSLKPGTNMRKVWCFAKIGEGKVVGSNGQQNAKSLLTFSTQMKLTKFVKGNFTIPFTFCSYLKYFLGKFHPWLRFSMALADVNFPNQL